MAAIGVALWKYVMRYAPHTPNYFNRDRFVLSNGKPLRIFNHKNRRANVIEDTRVCFSTPSSTSQATRP